jgi:enoyl-CoA hydratase/carnithine racemase
MDNAFDTMLRTTSSDGISEIRLSRPKSFNALDLSLAKILSETLLKLSRE